MLVAIYERIEPGTKMAKPTVAIIGASNDRQKFGNKSVRAHLRQGYEVFPVNPNEEEVEGLPAFKNIGDVPGHLNRISVYVPPPVTLKLLDDIAAKGTDEVWLNPGSEDEKVIERARALGLDPIMACSIVDLGISPHDLP